MERDQSVSPSYAHTLAYTHAYPCIGTGLGLESRVQLHEEGARVGSLSLSFPLISPKYPLTHTHTDPCIGTDLGLEARVQLDEEGVGALIGHLENALFRLDAIGRCRTRG
jgi:hypothetical protein